MIGKEELMEQVGANIKRIREASGLTQEKLAEKVNLDVKTLSKVERGKVGISLMTLYQLCEVLQVSSSVIMNKSSNSADVRGLTEQLEQLSPEQFAIANQIMVQLFRAFDLGMSE